MQVLENKCSNHSLNAISLNDLKQSITTSPYYTHHSVWKYGLYRHCVFPSMASLLCLVMSGIFHITVPLGVTAFNSSSPVQVCLGGDGWSSIGCCSVVLGCIWSSEIWGNINMNILQSSVFKNDTKWASIHV